MVTIYAASPSVVAGERYVWNGWTGAGTGSYSGTQNNTTLVTMNAPITETASWTHQYQISTSSNFGFVSPTSNSWINAGSPVTIYAVSPAATAGEQYLWNGWTGSGSGSYTGTSNNSALVTMNAPITESASWTHQYQITFAVALSDSGTITPSGSNVWENSGPLGLGLSPSSGYTFSQWTSSTGSITFSNQNVASTTAEVNGPGTITANLVLVPRPPLRSQLQRQPAHLLQHRHQLQRRYL